MFSGDLNHGVYSECVNVVYKNIPNGMSNQVFSFPFRKKSKWKDEMLKDEVLKRLNRAISEKNIKPKNIIDGGKKIGWSVTQSAISKVLNNKMDGLPSSGFIAVLIHLCPDLNVHWLLTGEGEAFRQCATEGMIREPSVSYLAMANDEEELLTAYRSLTDEQQKWLLMEANEKVEMNALRGLLREKRLGEGKE